MLTAGSTGILYFKDDLVNLVDSNPFLQSMNPVHPDSIPSTKLVAL